MALPRRQYIVSVKRGSRTRFGYGATIREAMSAAAIAEGEPFTYKLYEGQNQVECVCTGAPEQRRRWRERGK